MRHYYVPANGGENTAIHSPLRNEGGPPTCVSNWGLERGFEVGEWVGESSESREAEGGREGDSSAAARPCCCPLGLLSQSNPLQQTEWPACAYAAVAALVQVVSC